jgi:xanthine dehydrogenase accessory factor
MTALAFYLACQQRAEPCALVSILAIHGRAPRRVGAQVAVSMEGASGSLSGGCLDAAVVTAAREALISGLPRALRLGAGSDIVDLSLPCGSGLDLQIDPHVAPDNVNAIAQAYAARQRYFLHWPEREHACEFALARPNSVWQCAYYPSLRVVLAGRGETLLMCARLAQVAGYTVLALSPDRAELATLASAGMQVAHLASSTQLPSIKWDAYSAALSLFHDHDWELAFLSQALRSNALVVAAMGSVRAQELRRQALLECGIDARALAKLRGPFGLFERARAPNELALSMLSELAKIYRDTHFPEPVDAA